MSPHHLQKSCSLSTSGVSNTRPADAFEHLKKWHEYEVWSNVAFLRAFLVNCGPQIFFYNKLRPAKHFFSEMCPSDKFEFETPVLRHKAWMTFFCNSSRAKMMAEIKNFKWDPSWKYFAVFIFKLKTKCWMFFNKINSFCLNCLKQLFAMKMVKISLKLNTKNGFVAILSEGPDTLSTNWSSMLSITVHEFKFSFFYCDPKERWPSLLSAM